MIQKNLKEIYINPKESLDDNFKKLYYKRGRFKDVLPG